MSSQQGLNKPMISGVAVDLNYLLAFCYQVYLYRRNLSSVLIYLDNFPS
jgi:hypothetical protein